MIRRIRIEAEGQNKLALKRELETLAVRFRIQVERQGENPSGVWDTTEDRIGLSPAAHHDPTFKPRYEGRKVIRFREGGASDRPR